MPGDTLLAVKGLSVRFGNALALDDVSFQVGAGEIVGLTGNSGSGKSTLALALMGLTRRPGEIVAGTVALEGRDILHLPEAERRELRGRQIGLITQNPRNSLSPLHTVDQQVGGVLRAHGRIGRAEASGKVVGLLRRLGISDPERRAGAYPHELSGGMAQRVLIAMALGVGPRLLVADEPTSGLDVTIQAQFLDQMWQAARDTGSAVLLMTQDLGIIANYCDRVLVMEAGRLVAQDATPAFFAAPRDSYSREILSLEAAPAALPHEGGAPLLDVRGLSKAFTLRGSGKRLQAVNQVDLTLRRGETLGLVGESGSGKTTVGRCLLRLVDPEAGEVVFEGTDLLQLKPAAFRKIRRRVQIVFQDPLDALDPRWRVRDILGEAMEQPGPARITELLGLVGLGPETANQRPRDLSAGAQQRVSIARAVAADPALIVLDEPTSALTPLARIGIVRLLRDLQARFGTAFLFISHDLNTVEQLSHRVAVMYLGQVVELGTREQVFGDPRHPYSRALLAAHLVPDPSRRRVDRLAAETLEGEIPSPVDLPNGCFLASRCAVARPECATTRQELIVLDDGRALRCLPEAQRAMKRTAA